MRLETAQQFRLEQRMKLAPRIIQAMEILQLPLMALQERIDAEIQSNPVLEMRQPADQQEAPLEAADVAEDRGERQLVVKESGDEEFSRLEQFSSEYGHEFEFSDAPARPRDSGERDRKMDAMASAPAPEQSLGEYLLQQWAFVEAPEPVKQAGRLIIDNIDDDGYLRIGLPEVLKQSAEPYTPQQAAEALRLVQTLEPPGVGAADLKECLLLQLRCEAAAGANVELEVELVTSFLRDIEMNRLPQIARRTHRSLEQVKAAMVNLSRLNPRPGSLVGNRSVPVVSPDVVVDLDDEGQVVVRMADEASPRLHISRMYSKMARNRSADRDARAFLHKNMRSAQWLIGAIEQRRQTVLHVTQEVFKVQKDFLVSGPEALKPLPMADIAAKVGIHVATVSRAVSGKYVQTPKGVYPLRMFFSGGTTTAGGQDVAWDAIKLKLKELVAAEDKANPLNDDELAERLSTSGITIARRTVAKYRGLLEIPPARKRRQY